MLLAPLTMWGQVNITPVHTYDCYEVITIDRDREIRDTSVRVFGYQVQAAGGYQQTDPYIKSMHEYAYDLIRSQAHSDSVWYALETQAIESAKACDTIDIADYFMDPLRPSGSQMEFEYIDDIELSNYRIVNTVQCATIVYFETIQEHNDTLHQIMNIAVLQDSTDGAGDIRWSYPLELIPDKKERNKVLTQQIRDISADIICDIPPPAPFAMMWHPLERVKRTAKQKKVKMNTSSDIHYMNETELMTAVMTGTRDKKKKVQSIKVKNGNVLYYSGLIKTGKAYTVHDSKYTIIIGGQDIRIKPSKSLTNYTFDIY